MANEIRGEGAPLEVALTGQGRPLVLLHSLLTDRDAFDRVVPRLSRHHRVVALNLPGYGASPWVEGGIEAHADRVAETLCFLDLPPETGVLGNGFGGFVAAALAIRHGNLFGRLVLVDTGAAIPEQGKASFHTMAERVEQEGMAGVVDIALSRLFPQDFLAEHPEIAEERRAALLRMRPAVFAAACRALARLDLRPALPEIRNPTLVVVGLRDTATPPALSRELAAGIRGAHLVELPHCGHSPHIQDPSAFLDSVMDFLDPSRGEVRPIG